ncbi:MAG: adenosylhomocysteinase [Gammaproteobacteria bacterium]|jgi:adenosylhomocysteinase|nr:adenosylhomocysteinase [Gammaproteobacteria bacterium]
MSGRKIKDLSLHASGKDRVDWARQNMPILRALKQRLSVERPFEGHKIGICLHVEAKTGVWLETLIAGGASIAITGSPGSTQDDTAAYLVKELGVEVFAWRSETFDDHMENAKRVLDTMPTIIADNGGDLHHLLGKDDKYKSLCDSIIGATEETTTGANRLREELPSFAFPTIIINDTMAKRIVENRYGVGISVVDGIMRTTNIMLGGKTVVVIGYGYCGQGVAQRLRGLGAHVTVVDTEPLTQLEAHLEGFRTGVLEDVLGDADIVITVTGRNAAIQKQHFDLMKDGVVLCNAGQNSSEIDIGSLREMAVHEHTLRPKIEQLTLDSGKKFFLLAQGNLINLAGGDGNPIEVMDLGLALQALSLECIALSADTLNNEPQCVPHDIEQATLKAALQEWVDKSHA